MEIRPLASALGAEVRGVDLAGDAAPATWRALYAAFLQYAVLVIRDQALSPRAQRDLARRFGAPCPDPLGIGVDGVMEVTRIVKQPEDVENFGHLWHMDMSFLDCPPKASLLHAREVPAVGGDTVFASLAMACACLSDGMRALLDGLAAVHENWPNDLGRFKGIAVAERPRRRHAAVHPLLAPHPETGRLRLCVSPFYARQIAGMSLEESAAILGFLNDWTTRTEFTCRVRWEPGTLTVWDNRAVIHDVPSDDFGARLDGRGFRRVMHRVTVNEAREPPRAATL